MSIELYAFTTSGDICSLPALDMETAREFGNSLVDRGEWKTWDAFKNTDGRYLEPRLLESYQPAVSLVTSLDPCSQRT